MNWTCTAKALKPPKEMLSEDTVFLHVLVRPWDVLS